MSKVAHRNKTKVEPLLSQCVQFVKAREKIITYRSRLVALHHLPYSVTFWQLEILNWLEI
jgi:hypothetical protein